MSCYCCPKKPETTITIGRSNYELCLSCAELLEKANQIRKKDRPKAAR